MGKYCPYCRKYTESIYDDEDDIILCKRCGKKHKSFNFSKILIGGKYG